MTGTTPNQQHNGDPCDPATAVPSARGLKEFLDSALFAGCPGPNVTIPAPAAGQALIYADDNGNVRFLMVDEGELVGPVMDPDEARDIAQRLWNAADDADGGQ